MKSPNRWNYIHLFHQFPKSIFWNHNLVVFQLKNRILSLYQILKAGASSIYFEPFYSDKNESTKNILKPAKIQCAHNSGDQDQPDKFSIENKKFDKNEKIEFDP